MRTMWGDHDRFIDTYFTMYNDLYFTGDGCRIDEDGDYWLMGRIDDVVNVSGHRIGTAEVESALVSHAKVAEAAVAPMPHEIKGQGLYAFVTLVDGIEPSDELKKELVKHVRKEIGPIAAPDKIQFAPGAAQDPLRQDHAPHPAQDRRESARGRLATPRRWPTRRSWMIWWRIASKLNSNPTRKGPHHAAPCCFAGSRSATGPSPYPLPWGEGVHSVAPRTYKSWLSTRTPTFMIPSPGGLELLGEQRKEFAAGKGPLRAEGAGATESLGQAEGEP